MAAGTLLNGDLLTTSNALPVSITSSTAAALTPSDSTVLTATRSLYIGGAGDVKVDMATSGTAIIFKAVPVGTVLPVSVTKVYATGTTATLIVSLT